MDNELGGNGNVSVREYKGRLIRNAPRLLVLRVSQGFWGTREHWQNIEGNKGTLANFWEQGKKIRKITERKHSEIVWEHGNIGQFWKGTREQGPPRETLSTLFFFFTILRAWRETNNTPFSPLSRPNLSSS